MFVPERKRTRRERWNDLPKREKGAFAILATAIMLLAIAASVHHETLQTSYKVSPDPHLRVVDLDFFPSGANSGEVAYYAVGPLGQTDLGGRADGLLARYRFGSDWVSFSAAGSTYSGIESWKGLVGSSAPAVDGVRARYPQFYPSTGLEIVSGIDGMELILNLRSPTFIGAGDLAYSFFVETSPSLVPATSSRPMWVDGPGPYIVAGGIPLRDGTGRTVFMITPATALFEYRAAPGPVVSRVNELEYTVYFPQHDEGDRALVQLNYEVEFVGDAMKLSVIVPTELLSDPAIKWPLRIDPGITNPISNSSYFVDETILMDSDLVVTSTGAAQFSNVTLIMNRTSAPNYNISVESGGRMTLLSSRVKANDSALKYNFTVNGTFTAQDTVINNTNDGLKLLGESSTLSNVTIQGGTGRALVIERGNSTLTKVELKTPVGTGLAAQFANLQASYVNVTAAGGEGFYLNATSGNISWSHALNSTRNGAMIVNGSRVNITNSEFAGSGRNGVLVIGGAPSIEESSITENNWSGVALFDDHSAYLYGNRIASNNRSGIEARLNSTVDIYVNTIENNLQAGVRAIASDPNIERNLILNNSVGAWMEGAHNPGAKPGATADTEETYATLMAASGELGEGRIVPLAVGVTIAHTGASTQSAVPPATKQFTLQVTNTDTPGTPAKSIALSIDDDQPAWASLSQSSLSLSGGQSASVTLTIVVPGGAATGVTYDVKVHANMTSPPTDPKASVWAYVDLQASTTTLVSSITTGNSTTVVLNAVLMGTGGPLSGKTLAFKLDGHWIGEDATDSGGVASVEVTVSQPPLSQELLVYFNGTQYYAASSGSGYVNISWTASRLEAPDASGRWGDASSLTVRLMTTPGENPAAGRPIHFTLDGTYLGIGYTDRYGYASWVFEDAVEPGTVAWNASFNEDTYTGQSSNASNFTSLKETTTIAGPSFTIRYGETASHSPVLTDDEGYPLASRSVEFKRGSTSLGSATTDSQGLATFSDTGAASLTEGDYSMTYVFAAESHFNGITHYLTLTVRKWVSVFNVTDQTEHYGDTVELKAQLNDEAGAALQSKSVNVYLGTTLLGSVTTSSTGWAVYSDTANRLPKTYSLSFAFAADTRNTAINTTVNLTVLREITVLSSVVDARIVLGAVLAITIRLTDDEGNPLSRFINVTLLGGIYAAGTTDGSGYLTVNFDSRGMLPQRHVLWYFFDGDTNYSQSESYTRIVVEYDADLYSNLIDGNAVGVQANNSSSRIVANTIKGSTTNVWVTNGSLLIYNSSVGLSVAADYRIGSGGSVYSTNTTFNRGKTTFDAGAVLLHVRWYLNVRILEPIARQGQANVVILVKDVSGATILNKTTDAAGWFGAEAVTEYTQDGSGIVRKTPHYLVFTPANLTLLMDVSRNLTLFQGDDADLDGIPNLQEVASDVWWMEAETHAVEFTQVVEDGDASGLRAVRSLSSDLRFLDPDSFATFETGTYTVMLRMTSPLTNGTVRLIVKAENGTVLANETYTPSPLFRWFQTRPFVLLSSQALRLNLTDESANPAQAAIEVDEVVVARLKDAAGVWLHVPGQITDWLRGDTDQDGGLDGAEVRQSTVWYEAESLAAANASRVSIASASNSWVVEHAIGDITMLTVNETSMPSPGVYAVLLRGSGTVQIQRSIDGAAPVNTTLLLTGDAPAYEAYRFEYAAGHTFNLTIRDTLDTSQGLDNPQAWLDKLGFVLEEKRPWAYGYSRVNNSSMMPTDGTSPVYIGRETSVTVPPMVYWVSGNAIFSDLITTILINQTMNIAIASYTLAGLATQPVVFKAKDGTPMVAVTGGNTVYVFRVTPGPFLPPMSYAIAGGPTLLAAAYSEGFLAFSSVEGHAYGFKVTSSSLSFAWDANPSLSKGLGSATFFHDKVLYGFRNGLYAQAYNITAPAAESWRIGLGGWDVPDNATNATRAVAGSIVADVGNLFVLAYNETEADLFRLTEDGDQIWSVNLNWSIGLDPMANELAPRLVLRNNVVVVAGPTLRAIDRNNGTLMMGHDFGYGVYSSNLSTAALVTDREIIAPGSDGLYFFGYPDPVGFGDAPGTDGNLTFGAALVEDLLWKADESALVNRQPLMGDFDSSGYRDLIYVNATGFVFLKDFEVTHRNLLEFPQLGVGPAHGGNAEYLVPFVATDALDPDMDADTLKDGYEVAGLFGFDVVQAEDATDFKAWADGPTPGAPKNYNFFHQFGVTLTADDGSITTGAGQNVSWIRIRTGTPTMGTYRMTLVPDTSVKNVVDLRYLHGTDTTPEGANTTGGYGNGSSLSGRVILPDGDPILLTAGQLERLRQIAENATYLKVRYETAAPNAPPGTFTNFGVKHDAKITVFDTKYDPNTRAKMWATIYLSMEIDFELWGSMNLSQARVYEFELGLNLSLVPWASLGGDALPADLSLLRLLDLDELKFEKFGLDPYNNDTDGDQLKDGDEATGIPWNSDVDHDSLTDNEEINIYHTNPTERDTDHDGVRDRVELGLGGGYTGWASIPEWIAAKFRGDPHFRPPSGNRVLPNFDADTNTVTDPLDPDTDNDGIPDGWMDGWVYDPSWLVGQIQHSTATTEYLSRAAPVDYNVSFWHPSGVFDSYPQVWEGEDADLDGAVDGGTWSFWASLTNKSGSAADSTSLSFIRKGPGETNPAAEDSDGDGVPEGYEIWYATRDPVWKDQIEDNYFFTPTANDGELDVDQAYGLTPPINITPQSTSNSEALATGSTNLSAGIEIADPADPNVAILATRILLNLSAADPATTVTLELWHNISGDGNPIDYVLSATGSVQTAASWVDFDIPSTWMNFSSDRYFVVLQPPSSNISWYEKTGTTSTWYVRNDTGVWSNSTLVSKQPGIKVVDYFSEDKDNLTNLQEYLVGSDPKKRDTDAGTGGQLSGLGDALTDGDEMVNHTIFRTNATLGGLVSTNYGPPTWLLLDKALLTSADADWMYFEYLETATKPNETFGGAKDRTSFLFTLQDGAELRINVSASRLYVYLPGSDFENFIEDVNLTKVTHHYNGTALVFYQLNNSIPPSSYKTNALIPDMSNPWLFRFKQFYASDPFDWDTDDDGLADGWEVDQWNDSDGDFVPNVRDFDSDNDGLTDGQEMLQVQTDWTGEFGTAAANVKFDPENDTFYAMVDTDSDGDGIPDAKEVLWSVDTDRDNRINLVDWDSDGDGLCDGWCTNASTAPWRYAESGGVPGWELSTPPGLPNGEDENQNGTSEQGESSPVKVDTDDDHLWDGYSSLAGTAAGWNLAGVDGAQCPVTPTSSKLCGEESTYALYNGSNTVKTNRTNPDSDADGLTDWFEVHGFVITVILTGGTEQRNLTNSDPWKNDTDADGIRDPVELFLGSNLTSNDTDLDSILDGTEDKNRDGARQVNETSVIRQDTDGDGLADGEEDIDFDGVKDTLEPDPLKLDTDGDMIPDKTEFDLMKSGAGHSSWTVTHDYDGDGKSDLNDKDADNDGLDDGWEDWNLNATISSTNETDPYDNDTDDDLLLDGAEPSIFVDSDGDGNINGRDTNSNGDSYTDDLQVWVVFRTNATDGNYVGAGKWIALIAPSANPDTRTANDYLASSALYTFTEELASPPGAAQIQNPYGPLGTSDVVPLETPEGYPVLFATNGSSYDIFIDLPGTTYAKYIKNGSPPSDYTTSNRNVSSFLANKQETYDGRAALNPDTDFDGINNTRETSCGLNTTNADTDGDGIGDRNEYPTCRDSDLDGHADANDTDSDNDGILDNVEDQNLNGWWDAGETDAARADTDLDGIADGTEDADQDAIRDAGETSPIDRDTDDDGIADKAEVDGTWCYFGESASACSGANHNDRKTGPLDTDSDDDGLLDGQEIGLTSAGVDTLVSVFKADSDPSSTTNPKVADTDADGLSDRLEDANLNGRVDSGEANPTVWDTDSDGLCDGNCSGKGEDKNLNGIRDQDADGNYTETNFLANDSDVDGILDGQETNGTWSYKSGAAGCPGEDKNPCKLNALNADFDGDGLRDGQETAGWMVGIWHESTFEKMVNGNYTVNSNPAVTNSDTDALNDFSEFMNGSDPRKLDTDGDGITDTQEIERGSNITGVEGTPPRIENFTWNLLITKELWGVLYLPTKVSVILSFDVIDNVGIAYVDINFTRYNGPDPRRVPFSTNPASYTWSAHITEVFNFSWAEALSSGAYVYITAYDVNGNGGWGDFRVKNVLEVAVDWAIAIFLAPIAKMIVEAASAAFDWIWGMMKRVIDGALEPLVSGIAALIDAFWRAVGPALMLELEGGGATALLDLVFLGPIGALLEMLGWVMLAISLILLVVTNILSFLIALIASFVVDLVIMSMMGTSPDDGEPQTPNDITLGFSPLQTLRAFIEMMARAFIGEGAPVSRAGEASLVDLVLNLVQAALGISAMVAAFAPGSGAWKILAIGMIFAVISIIVDIILYSAANNPYLVDPDVVHSLAALGVVLALVGLGSVLISIKMGAADANPVIRGLSIAVAAASVVFAIIVLLTEHPVKEGVVTWSLNRFCLDTEPGYVALWVNAGSKMDAWPKDQRPQWPTWVGELSDAVAEFEFIAVPRCNTIDGIAQTIHIPITEKGRQVRVLVHGGIYPKSESDPRYPSQTVDLHENAYATELYLIYLPLTGELVRDVVADGRVSCEEYRYDRIERTSSGEFIVSARSDNRLTDFAGNAVPSVELRFNSDFPPYGGSRGVC